MSPSVRTIIACILPALLAAMLIFSGGHKLMDLAGTSKMFEGMGMPGWLGSFTGAAEVLGGIGLLVPRTVRPAAMGLLLIIIGAVFMHASKITGGLAKGVPAIVSLLLLAVVLVLRRRTAVRAA